MSNFVIIISLITHYSFPALFQFQIKGCLFGDWYLNTNWGSKQELKQESLIHWGVNRYKIYAEFLGTGCLRKFARVQNLKKGVFYPAKVFT